MTDEKQPIEKIFDKCPNCGSTNQFVGSLAKEVKKRGLIPENVSFYAEIAGGTVIDPKALQRLPIGSSFPAYQICKDVCTDCGTIYAAKLVLMVATKTIQPIQRAGPGISGLGGPGLSRN